jgi:hypothetical protein
MVIAWAAVLGLGTAWAAEPEVRLPARDKFHVYLLMGQSNMAGRGKVTEADRRGPDRVLKLDADGRWVPAADPIHFDKPTAGVGPGSGFGPAMAAADETVVIGLVPCAVGGTPLSRWVKGADLYEQAVKRARLAQEHGTLKGVIWHQGESDSTKQPTADSYGERLAGMVRDLRGDLKTPSLPFVVGKLGAFIKPGTLAYMDRVNNALGELPKQVPLTACVETDELKGQDTLHFDAESARELGRRYARAMLELQKTAK